MNVLTDIPMPAAAAIAAIVPLAVGMIWYNPKVFGKPWMDATGLTTESARGMNMPVVFGLTYLFSFFMAFGLLFITIHEYHLYSMVMSPEMKDPHSALFMWVRTTMSEYGSNYRSFRHGALHGTIAGIELALPIVAINAMFERKSAKYIAINAGFWIICMCIMGGIVCHCAPRLMM